MPFAMFEAVRRVETVFAATSRRPIETSLKPWSGTFTVRGTVVKKRASSAAT
jgi:hypothetical protein